MVKILAALSILNTSGASPGATKKVAALVARASCSGVSHSSGCYRENHKVNKHYLLYGVIESSLRKIIGSKNSALINLSKNFCETTIYDNKVFLKNLVAVHKLQTKVLRIF